jgi:2-methylaconitate cis-trans-isomerase PrpF
MNDAIEVDLMRGGTSKGVFIRLGLLSTDPRQRDALALGLMGSPDPMQLDGLGGTHSSTSKLMAVGTPVEAEAAGYSVPVGVDVVYLFAQVAVAEPTVDWRGNCGNLTAGVAVYAMHRRLVPVVEPVTTVELFNLNSGARVTCRVPAGGGEPLERGDFAIAGVPGTGARIDLTFHDPHGATGRLLPTGHRWEWMSIDGEQVAVTILDVTNPVVVVRAGSLGMAGTELPATLNQDADLLARIEALRAEAAMRCGLVRDITRAREVSPAVPRVIIISAPRDHQDVFGASIAAHDADYVVRTSSMGVIHHAFTGTGLMAAAVAALLPGTVFDGLARRPSSRVRLSHPKGVVDVEAELDDLGTWPHVRSVTIARTARRLLYGLASPSPTRPLDVMKPHEWKESE